MSLIDSRSLTESCKFLPFPFKSRRDANGEYGETSMHIHTLVIIFVIVVTLSACVNPSEPLTQRNSQLTQGNVQMNLIVGQTTKAEVLETFGGPNITTRDGTGREVWTYQRAAQISQASGKSGYWTIILAGQSSRSSGFESSTSMITLIIKFDEHDVVSDFRSRTSKF